MSCGIKLHIWGGGYACFTRPEMKVERVSHDVITPSATRGVLDAIHWKPAICWVVDRIHVLNPIRFETLRRNELGGAISGRSISRAIAKGSTMEIHTVIEKDRQQRATTLLRDLAYLIESHFQMTEEAGEMDSKAKHLSIFSVCQKTSDFKYRPVPGEHKARLPRRRRGSECSSGHPNATKNGA